MRILPAVEKEIIKKNVYNKDRNYILYAERRQNIYLKYKIFST